MARGNVRRKSPFQQPDQKKATFEMKKRIKSNVIENGCGQNDSLQLTSAHPLGHLPSSPPSVSHSKLVLFLFKHFDSFDNLFRRIFETFILFFHSYSYPFFLPHSFCFHQRKSQRKRRRKKCDNRCRPEPVNSESLLYSSIDFYAGRMSKMLEIILGFTKALIRDLM